MNESGTDPGRHLLETFAGSWLQHRPKPEWIVTDPQSSLAKGDFAEWHPDAASPLRLVRLTGRMERSRLRSSR